MPKLTVRLATVSAQQPDGAVALTVRLRAADGKAIVGETVILQRLPDEADVAPACKSDMLGACTWYVARGLYQVLFERPLDEVSTLALAEGGLRGYGLTVGEEAITYHFTVHGDGHVYFDAAPQAAMPVPIIPAAAHLHGGAEATPLPEATVMPTATTEPQLVAMDDGEDDEGAHDIAAAPRENAAAIDGHWRLLILAGTGLMAGSGLHWWTHRRNRQKRSARRHTGQQGDGAINREVDHA